MKRLSYGRMAAARLSAGKKAYIGLGIGVFLSAFLAMTVFLSAYGVILAKNELKRSRVGLVDAVVLDNPDWKDADILAEKAMDQLGHVYTAAAAAGSELYYGWADETALALLDYRVEEGRLPERAGELAAERGALIALELPQEPGSGITLTLEPIDGIPEEKSFTLVGVLGDRSPWLEQESSHIVYSDESVTKFPALLGASSGEAFATGRLAVQRLLSLKDGLSQRKLQKLYKGLPISNRIFAADWEGRMQFPFEALPISSLARDKNAQTLLALILLLGLSLLVSSGVVISGSMETLLSSRREEIGILRAIGASKRQIRRIFGLDALLLGVLLLPLAILAACGFTSLLASRAPGILRFGFSFWLILPALAVSLISIAIAQYRPLKRAGRLMPMSVIRDTQLLRRAKKIKSSPSFRIDGLLAKRCRQLYPRREKSTAFFLLLMTCCCGLLPLAAQISLPSRETAAFTVDRQSYLRSYDDFFSDYSGHELNQTDLQQIRSLPHVTGVEQDHLVNMTLLTEEECRYFDETQFRFGPGHWARPESQAAVRKMLQTDRTPVPNVYLLASDRVLEEMIKALPAGTVSRTAIDQGSSVLVQAPTWWKNGTSKGYYAAGEARDPGDVMIKKNDCFYPGTALELAVCYIEQPIPRMLHEGVVLDNLDKTGFRRLSLVADAVLEDRMLWSSGGDVVMVTSVEGFRQMDLPRLDVLSLRIHTEEKLSLEEEQQLERRLDAILRRSDSYQLTNLREEARQKMTRARTVQLLFAALAAVFFAVSVGLAVSGTARKLQSDIRSIGMLRAVGAEERDLVRSYLRPVLRGAGITLAAAELLIPLIWFGLWGISAFAGNAALLSALTMAVFSAASVLCCALLIRREVRLVTKKSIIENIREL